MEYLMFGWYIVYGSICVDIGVCVGCCMIEVFGVNIVFCIIIA